MKNRHFVYIILLVLLLGILLLWYAGRPKPERVVKVKPTRSESAESARMVQKDVSLYFASDDGEYLVSETRQVSCSGESGCVRAIVDALISGPVLEGSPVLPAKSRIRDVRIEEGTAILDFGPELQAGHPGGSQSELLTVYALANSVAVNFPHLRQVAVTVNGAQVETLKGHVDLRRPLIADFTFARQSVEERLAPLPDLRETERSD